MELVVFVDLLDVGMMKWGVVVSLRVLDGYIIYWEEIGWGRSKLVEGRIEGFFLEELVMFRRYLYGDGR